MLLIDFIIKLHFVANMKKYFINESGRMKIFGNINVNDTFYQKMIL